jgi:hypothetical protein
MARGLKIAHKESSGVLHDQRVTNQIYQGGVGGIPQWVTSTGVRTLKVQYVTAAGVQHANAYIITQRGAKQFMVANAVGAVESYTHSNASVTTCTLVNLATPTVASTMSITGYTTANTSFNASRITSKHVYDFAGNKYRYRHAATQVATSEFANVVVH